MDPGGCSSRGFLPPNHGICGIEVRRELAKAEFISRWKQNCRGEPRSRARLRDRNHGRARWEVCAAKFYAGVAGPLKEL